MNTMPRNVGNLFEIKEEPRSLETAASMTRIYPSQINGKYQWAKGSILKIKFSSTNAIIMIPSVPYHLHIEI